LGLKLRLCHDVVCSEDHLPPTPAGSHRWCRSKQGTIMRHDSQHVNWVESGLKLYQHHRKGIIIQGGSVCDHHVPSPRQESGCIFSNHSAMDFGSVAKCLGCNPMILMIVRVRSHIIVWDSWFSVPDPAASSSFSSYPPPLSHTTLSSVCHIPLTHTTL